MQVFKVMCSMTSFWCLHSYLQIYFTTFSSVPIVDFEQVNGSWDELLASFYWLQLWKRKNFDKGFLLIITFFCGFQGVFIKFLFKSLANLTELTSFLSKIVWKPFIRLNSYNITNEIWHQFPTENVISTKKTDWRKSIWSFRSFNPF